MANNVPHSQIAADDLARIQSAADGLRAFLPLTGNHPIRESPTAEIRFWWEKKNKYLLFIDRTDSPTVDPRSDGLHDMQC